MKSPNDLLLLIDIDGTLLSTNGVAVNFMIKAVENETGIRVDLDFSDFIGRLDPQIVRALLQKCGLPDVEIDQKLPSVFNDYLDMLAEYLKPGQVTVYNGVRDFLEYISARNLNFGLLTGNARQGADIKLKTAGLDHYFQFGAYGDEGDNREQLVPLAITRAENRYNRKFSIEDIWIIGDSVNDVRCAKANGIKSLIVQTGRSDIQKLKEASPEILMQYLDNAPAIIREILNLSGQSNE